MRAWTRILCGVDFSATSSRAMECAAELARAAGAELTVLHVHQPMAPLTPELLAWREPMGDAAVEEVRRKLEAWRVEAERIAGQRVTARVEHGLAATVIPIVARELACDLVVTGSHSRHGLERALLGSVAERVVRDAPCAVLVVREGPPPED
jgi:nucleotide-binding universal stress UspA family protein